MFLKSKEVEQLTTCKYPSPYIEICSRAIKPAKVRDCGITKVMQSIEQVLSFSCPSGRTSKAK